MMGQDPSGSSLGDEPNGFNSHRCHLPQSYTDLLNWNPDGPIDWDAAHTVNEAPPYHGPNGTSCSPPPPYTRSPPPSYTRSPSPSHVEIYPNSLEAGAPKNSPPLVAILPMKIMPVRLPVMPLPRHPLQILIISPMALSLTVNLKVAKADG